jgi:hypothetical protein
MIWNLEIKSESFITKAKERTAMSNDKNTQERQDYYITEYQNLYSEISDLETQIIECSTKLHKLHDKLETLRNQEKTEFEYGKED